MAIIFIFIFIFFFIFIFIFRKVPFFYLPIRLDYRGRLYYVTEYLNYQGIELAKGLLQFSIGEKVYLNDDIAIKYLKIFGVIALVIN